MRPVFSILIFILIVSTASAQTFEPKEEDWSSGHLTLKSGEQLTGRIFYRELKQTVYFEQENEMRALKAVKVSNFDFYDSAEGTNRTFVSVPFKRNPNAPEKTEFLEIIRKYNRFMVLSVSNVRKVTIPRNKYVGPQTIHEVLINWYLLDDDGIQPLYFSFQKRAVFGPKVEFYNEALFKKIIGPYQEEINRFSAEKKLKPEKPNENLLLLDKADSLNSIVNK